MNKLPQESASEPKVVSVKKESLRRLGYKSLEDWLSDPNHIYIGRDMSSFVKGAVGSKWQNPFREKEISSLDERLRLFEEYLMGRSDLLCCIDELKGKDLGCWCKNNGNERCHGDLLLKLANKPIDASRHVSLKPKPTLTYSAFSDSDFPPLK